MSRFRARHSHRNGSGRSRRDHQQHQREEDSHRNGAVSTVSHTSDRTITGVAEGSTQRTINATSSGTEKTTFENRDGVTVTLEHSATDAVKNVIVPVTSSTPKPYPTAARSSAR